MFVEERGEAIKMQSGDERSGTPYKVQNVGQDPVKKQNLGRMVHLVLFFILKPHSIVAILLFRSSPVC